MGSAGGISKGLHSGGGAARDDGGVGFRVRRGLVVELVGHAEAPAHVDMADVVAVAAQGEFLFPEGAYRNSYHYLFTIAGGRIVSGREYLDTQIAARFYAG